MSIQSLLQHQLARLYPRKKDALTLGKFHFKDQHNYALLFALIQQAQHSSPQLLSYKSFQNFFNPALSPKKPTKPSRDNPAYHDPTRKAIYSPQKYRVYQIWRYQQDLKKYHQRLEDYQKKVDYLQFVLQHYPNDSHGYIRFIYDKLPQDEKAFFRQTQTYQLSEQARQRHSYITGQTGSGKTELIKILIHHYLTVNTNTALILIDPHGDIAQQVAQFKENTQNDRLVYIDPFLSLNHSPILNPFQLPNKNTPIATIDLITEELYLVFRDILKSSFTPQMETLLRPCITTLLLMGDKDINDLQYFMDDENNQYYLNFAFEHLYNPSQVYFLKNDFHKDSYNPTKQAIKTKLQSLLNSYTFRNLLTGKQTFHLSSLCQQKKLIIFNLSAGKIGNTTSNVIGRFILAQIKSMAFQRADVSESLRTPTHVFIDECQRYISPTIETLLAEARKYKVYLTLANQYYGQNMGTETRHAITNNTAIKIAGRNGDKNAQTHHKETGADIEELKHLAVGEFHIKEENNISIKIKVPNRLINHKNAMSYEQWDVLKSKILSTYYQPLPVANKPTESNKTAPLMMAQNSITKPLFEIE